MKLGKTLVLLLFLFAYVTEIWGVAANAASNPVQTKEKNGDRKPPKDGDRGGGEKKPKDGDRGGGEKKPKDGNGESGGKGKKSPADKIKDKLKEKAERLRKELEEEGERIKKELEEEAKKAAVDTCKENAGDLADFCDIIDSDIDFWDFDELVDYVEGLINDFLAGLFNSLLKEERATPFDCECNEIIFPQYRSTEYNYSALNHLFKCVGKYIRHWQSEDFEYYLEKLNEFKEYDDGDTAEAEEAFRNQYPYETTVAEIAEGSPTPWRYNIFLPGVKQEFLKNIIVSRNIEDEPNIEQLINEDDEKFREYIKEFVERGEGYEKYCHVINEKQWNPESENKIAVPNPRYYLPYERIYFPEQSPWYPRNTVVGTMNASMDNGNAVGNQIGYFTTRASMEPCDDIGCEPCDKIGDYNDIDDPQTCYPDSWWHTKYARCGLKAPLCNGKKVFCNKGDTETCIRESVEILESRAEEYKTCINLFSNFRCLEVNCIKEKNPEIILINAEIGKAGLEVLESDDYYPASGGYCCSIIEPHVTPKDAMGLNYNMLEVRDYRNAWRNEAPSTRPNLEELGIGAPQSIWDQPIAQEHLESDIEHFNFWWPWWARAHGSPIESHCTTKKFGDGGGIQDTMIMMTVPKPYWTWPDTGTMSPHNDPFHDSISPGVAGANCGYGGWAETKLYQARCMKHFKMNCICRYEQTFKIGSAEEYVMRMIGGLYLYIDEDNGKKSAALWPFPWQGYVSNPISIPKEKAENEKGFPIGLKDGYFELVDGGLDNAEAGDIVVWDHARGKHPFGESAGGINSSYIMLPHVAYIIEAKNTLYINELNKEESEKEESEKEESEKEESEKEGSEKEESEKEESEKEESEKEGSEKEEKDDFQHYVVVREFNYGKIPDSCGNTTNWGRQTERIITPYKSMERDIQKNDSGESPTCLDPENTPCEDPFWEVGKRSPRVYRLLEKEVENTENCDYTGLDSYDILYKKYREASEKYDEYLKLKSQVSDIFGALKSKPEEKKFEDYLVEYYELKERIENNIEKGCYPPYSWREPILNSPPNIIIEEATGDFLFSRQIAEESTFGESSSSDLNLKASQIGGTTGFTKRSSPTSRRLDSVIPSKPGGCYTINNTEPKGNPEMILDTINETSETSASQIYKAYTYLNSLADSMETNESGAEKRLNDLVEILKSENDTQTETLMALMSYQYYDSCCSQSNSAIESKDIALEQREAFKESMENLEYLIDSGTPLSDIINDLTVTLTDYFYFEVYFIDASRNILSNLSGCSNSRSDYFNTIETEILSIVEGLKNLERIQDIPSYRDLADILYDNNQGAWKITKSALESLSNIADDIENYVWIKSRSCSPDTEDCDSEEAPVYNPLNIGNISKNNCSYIGLPTDEPPTGLTCQEPPKTCSEAPRCWKQPLEPTCDMYGSLDFKRGLDPFAEYSLEDSRHRDEGYSRDLVAEYLYLYTDFSTASSSEYITPLLENLPIEWCNLDIVQDRIVRSERDIESGVTVAVIVSDRYENGHASMVYEYDDENSCVYLYGQNWLEHECQEFTEGNCYQSYSSFNTPIVSPNCIPMSSISYMWNAVCDDKHPCDD